MLNIYNNVVRYMYTERKQMRNMVHQYERGLYHHTGKNGEAQLKFELNNYLFRGLIKLKKCRFMPLKKFYKYRFNFTNICTLVYHSTVKWLTKPNKMFKTQGSSTNSLDQSLSERFLKEYYYTHKENEQ